MARRRHSSTKPVRDRAADDGVRVTASVLADRLVVLEGMCEEMKHALDVQFHRIAAIQAQLDHMVAKVTGR